MTLSIAQARAHDKAEPITLVEIELKNSGGTVYFSDRNITVSSQRYDDYISNASDVGNEVQRVDSSGLNSNVTLNFKNDKFRTYDYLILINDTYPFTGAKCTIKEVYLLNGAQSATETIFVGRCDSPQNINLLGFTISVSSIEFVEGWKNRLGA